MNASIVSLIALLYRSLRSLSSSIGRKYAGRPLSIGRYTDDMLVEGVKKVREPRGWRDC